MAIIRSLVKGLTDAFAFAKTKLVPGTKRAIEQAFAKREYHDQRLVRDIVQSIHHVSPETIAPKLQQATRTTARLIDTEATTIAWPWDLKPKQNMIVAARLKSARRYRVVIQATETFSGQVLTGRKYFSFYTNSLGTYEEMAQQFTDKLRKRRSSDTYDIKDITFHHLMHQRGATY